MTGGIVASLSDYIYNGNMSNFISYLLEIFGHAGYWGVVFLMTLESSIFPVPSELVIPPAAYLASKGEMNLWLIIVAGVVGSLIGASLSYLVAYWLGKIVVYKLADHRIAKTIFISSAKIKKAEDFFLKYGKASIFFGRLLPVVRHLISLPAGFCKMNFNQFFLYTFLGSTIWVSVLALAGYYFGLKTELIAEYYRQVVSGLIILVIFAGVIYFIIRRRKV